MPDPMLVDGNPLIILRLDEKLFYTTKDTLVQESGYFAALFSGRWPDSSKDGVLTLDADADVFKHIMRFFRSGVLPVFYDGLKGFDHQLYSLLLEQAEFFLIDRLRDWILEKRYLQAVKLVRSVKLSESTRWIDVDSDVADRGLHKFDNREYTGDTKVEHFVYSTNRKFRACEETSCDRDGEPQTSYCTEICSRIPQDGQDYVERDVVNLVEVCTKTVFDHRICREIGQEFDALSHP